MTLLTSMTTARRHAVVALAAGALLLSACGNSSSDAASSSPASSGSAGSSSSPADMNGTSTPGQGDPVVIVDQWAKAIPDLASAKMTAVFGMLKNTSDAPVTIVSGKNSISEVTELHETVMVDGAKKMRPVASGFTIEPGQTRELKPGADHIMVMELTKPLKVGEEITVTLKTKDDQTIEFTAVARAFTGANETYMPKPM